MGGLSAKERAVLSLKHGLEDGVERTGEQIGELMKFSRQRANHLYHRAVAKIRLAAERQGVA